MLIPEFCFFVVVCLFFHILQDLTMHINVSGEQHTHSIKQLLKNISINPESLKELSRWGLEIGSDILVVRPFCKVNFHFLSREQ